MISLIDNWAMPDIRLAIDLNGDSPIGRFQYRLSPQSHPTMPTIGQSLAIDAAARYLVEVFAVTATYERDRQADFVVWTTPQFASPLAAEEIWDFGFRPAWFESFRIGRKTLTAAELIKRLESGEARERRRAKTGHVVVTVGLGVLGSAAYDQRAVAEHLLMMDWKDIVMLFRALAQSRS